MTRAVTLLLAAAVILPSSAALADVSKDACIDANAAAQKLRAAGQFSAAREKLAVCADRSCPALVRDDCVKRSDELDRAQPTIVFDVKDAAGNDVPDVRVTMDGQPLAGRFTGAALRVDPGQHTFVLEASGKAPVTRTLVIKEGEKDRREAIRFAGPGPAPAAAPADATPETPPPATPASDEVATSTPPEAPPASGGLGTRKVIGIVAGGAGAAGIVAGSVFGLLTMSAIHAQKNDCSSSTQCPNYAQAQSDHANEQTFSTVSTVAFIAGGALLATGAVVYFLGGSPRAPAASGLVVAPSVGPGGGGIGVTGAF